MAAPPTDFDLEAIDTTFLPEEEKARVIRAHNCKVRHSIRHAIELMEDNEHGHTEYGVYLLKRLFDFETVSIAHKATISYIFATHGMANYNMDDDHYWGEVCVMLCQRVIELENLQKNSHAWTIFQDMIEVAEEKMAAKDDFTYDEDEDEEIECESDDESDSDGEETDSDEEDVEEIEEVDEETEIELTKLADAEGAGGRFVCNSVAFKNLLTIAILATFLPDRKSYIKECITIGMPDAIVRAEIDKHQTANWTAFVVANVQQRPGHETNATTKQITGKETQTAGETPSGSMVKQSDVTSRKFQQYVDNARNELSEAIADYDTPVLTTTLELRPKRAKHTHAPPTTAEAPTTTGTAHSALDDRPLIENFAALHMSHAFGYPDPSSNNESTNKSPKRRTSSKHKIIEDDLDDDIL